MQRITLDSEISYVVTEKELKEIRADAIHRFAEWLWSKYDIYKTYNSERPTVDELLKNYERRCRMVRGYDDNGNVVDLVKWEEEIRADGKYEIQFDVSVLDRMIGLVQKAIQYDKEKNEGYSRNKTHEESGE